MKKAFFLLLMAAFLFSACTSDQFTSPDKSITVDLIKGDNGQIFYSIQKSGNAVLELSDLGIVMNDDDFSQGLKLDSVSESETVTDNYHLLYGKRSDITYTANKKVFYFTNKDGKKMDIIFQISDDGVAFRYFFPADDNSPKEIINELTTFNFPEDAKAFLQPCADSKSGWAKTNPSYEEHYFKDIPVGTPSPTKAGWVYPALFNVGNDWVIISETGLTYNYCATRLEQNSPEGEYKVGFPQEQEVIGDGQLLPKSDLPWYSPWRIIAIGSLKTITESTLGTDMADPAIKGDFSWVKPGRSSWSWVLLKDNSVRYPVQKEFIDYAADMGWEYCLVDGLWDTQIGYDKIAELAKYAATKNVGLFLWYNSAGDWNETYQTPKNRMLTHESRMEEFTRIKNMGIKGMKIDFFGGDGESVIKYYQDILKDAADAQLMVVFHGCTLPRGWQRTYPNLLSMESVKGMEFITFGQVDADSAATHCAMLPFARNVFDPMDFTPVAFSELGNVTRKTSNAFELALSVLFISGDQHYAETPEGISKVPVYVKDFLKDVPVDWDETHFISGYPGKYVIIARKKGDTWFIGGINGSGESITESLDLSFANGLKGLVITDGNDNRSFKSDPVEIDVNNEFGITLPAKGGFVMQLK